MLSAPAEADNLGEVAEEGQVEVTRSTNPCDHCGLDDLGRGLRVAHVRCIFGEGILELCESYFEQNREAIEAKADEIIFLQSAKVPAAPAG